MSGTNVPVTVALYRRHGSCSSAVSARPVSAQSVGASPSALADARIGIESTNPDRNGAIGVDQVDDPGQHVWVGLGQHAVAEVEHVPGRGRRPRASTRRTSASMAGHGANSTHGSRLP